MNTIIDMLEPGEYPAGADDLTLATLSLAVSARRIADILENPMIATAQAPATRVIGGGARNAPAPAAPAPVAPAGLTRQRDPNALAAGKPIPDEPIPKPPGFLDNPGAFGETVGAPGTPLEGKPIKIKTPIDPMAQVTVIWRNGHRQHGAAQQFFWLFDGAKEQPHEVLYYLPDAPDPARFSAVSAELNVPLERTTPGGEG